MRETLGSPRASAFENSVDPSSRAAQRYKFRVLIVDSDPSTIRLCKQVLEAPNFTLSVLNSGYSAVELLQKLSFDILICDMMTPRLSGLHLLSKAMALANPPEVILTSTQPSVEAAVEAVRMGAVDFLVKPLRVPAFQEAVRRACDQRRTTLESGVLSQVNSASPEDFLGQTRNPRMQEIQELIHKVAKSNSTILITGDSGVGKEVIARTIHNESLRCNGSFTDISCAAITETLLESELFGHEKGSFTGADASKPGLLELANGGTLFLDEIGEIGPILQTKLLRVIETRSFYRVGGTKQITVDVRILAATNKDLKRAVEEGKFRKDLFYRLNTINIDVPPLRDRQEDIPLLVEQFVGEFDRSRQRRFSAPAMEALQRYSWPGNVRELRNVIERVLLISPQMLIDVEDLPTDILNAKEPSELLAGHEPALPDSLEELERRQIAAVLQRTRWHRGRAAELLAISPKTLYRKIRQYELDKTIPVV
jgi:two-component system response regulator AtoC